MSYVTYVVREGGIGELSGPILCEAYNHPGAAEPQVGAILDTEQIESGPWRVVTISDATTAGRTLIVESLPGA